MDLGLKDRVALVTGASRGIGRATAVILATEGARVAVTYRRSHDLAETMVDEIRDAGGDGLAVCLDLASDDSVQATVAGVVARWGRVDILVNNALQWLGPSQAPTRFDRLGPATWKRLIRTNVDGPVATVQAVLPSMVHSRWGRIVNVSSTAVEDGMRGFGWYPVAKAALHGLTRALSHEFASLGIFTNVVMPGPTLTERLQTTLPPTIIDRWAASHTAIGRFARPEEVARLIVYLASAANSTITGQAIRVGGHGTSGATGLLSKATQVRQSLS